MEYPYYSRSRLLSALEDRGGAILKSKGQNFLIDPNAVRLIGESVLSLWRSAAGTSPILLSESSEGSGTGIALESNVRITEIGPGTGALSYYLLRNLQMASMNGRFLWEWQGIEIDPVMVSILRETILPLFSDSKGTTVENIEDGKNVTAAGKDGDASGNQREGSFCATLIEDDARSYLIDHSARPGCFDIICGNLPYYISTELLLAAIRCRPDACAFLFQKEYAGRVLSGGKSNSLSVFVRNGMLPTKGPTIGKNAFLPPPSVDSQVLLLSKIPLQCDPDRLERVLRCSFQGKRKTLQNSWRQFSASNGLELEALTTAARAVGLDLTRRAEDVLAEEFYNLVNRLESG
ncbi:MAG: hypothetical protein KDK33_07175 [Leptospiraceae bacterium]|nr:hypothetical protein [Leptospiraceae bacterium]